MTDANRILSNGSCENSTGDESDSAGGPSKVHTCYMMSNQGMLIPYYLKFSMGYLKVLSFQNGAEKASLPLRKSHGRLLPKESCEESKTLNSKQFEEEHKDSENAECSQ